MSQDEKVLFIGDALFHQGGCLWLPFVRSTTAGRMTVTFSEVTFEPVFFWRFLTRPLVIPVPDILGVEVGGATIDFSIMGLTTIGRPLTVHLKKGGNYRFRSMNAEGLAMAINTAVTERRG